MCDRQSENWWQQFTGQGIVGRCAGATLTQVLSTIASFQDFVKAYPQGRVLSRETGHVRAYGKDPYRGYDRIGDQPFLFRDPVDPRLPAMERVIGITRGGKTRVLNFDGRDMRQPMAACILRSPGSRFIRSRTCTVGRNRDSIAPSANLKGNST